MTIRRVAPIALVDVLPALTSAFEAVHDGCVTTTFMLNPDIPGHILAGAGFDIAISNPDHLAVVLNAGLAEPSSHRPFLRSALVFAKLGPASGAPARTPDDIAACLLAAPTIAYTGTGTSGKMLHTLMARLGIAERVAERLLALEGGGPRRALLAGECAIAALPHSNAAAIPGAGVVAICPPSLGVHIDMSLVLHPDADQAAHAFAAFLRDPVRDQGLRAAGGIRFSFAEPSA